MARPLRIGLLGLGPVGMAVAKAIQDKDKVLERRIGAPLELRRVWTRTRGLPRSVDDSLLCYDVEEILSDPEIDLVVELLPGEHPAYEYVKRALLAGKHVVTGNKEVMAKHGPEILSLAAEKHVDISFEASVGGGIPVIGPFKLDLLANEIHRVRAIINGTTNFILTQMASHGSSFEDALAEAQALGYAEADPSKDVDGIDAMFKLTILGSLAFHMRVSPDDVYHEGISALAPADFRYARELGYAIKLLAIGEAEDGGVVLRVHPTLLRETEMLAKVDGVFNAVAVEGDLVGPILFYGRGAGGGPTSSAVVADIIDLAQRSLAGTAWVAPPAFEDTYSIRSMDDVRTGYYLRLLAYDRPGVFAQITRVLGEAEISIASVIQKENVVDGQPPVEYAEVVLMTHRTREATMQGAVRAIAALPSVFKIGSLIRVEE
ncbi:MAG: homoserine dehydrogenase [Chloroflexi bacterium]|nr:homoserine dehydrogenase [Chloroflexota bacterium]